MALLSFARINYLPLQIILLVIKILSSGGQIWQCDGFSWFCNPIIFEAKRPGKIPITSRLMTRFNITLDQGVDGPLGLRKLKRWRDICS